MVPTPAVLVDHFLAGGLRPRRAPLTSSLAQLASFRSALRQASLRSLGLARCARSPAALGRWRTIPWSGRTALPTARLTGTIPVWSTNLSWNFPVTGVTAHSEHIGNTFGPKGFAIGSSKKQIELRLLKAIVNRGHQSWLRSAHLAWSFRMLATIRLVAAGHHPRFWSSLLSRSSRSSALRLPR